MNLVQLDADLVARLVQVESVHADDCSEHLELLLSFLALTPLDILCEILHRVRLGSNLRSLAVPELTVMSEMVSTVIAASSKSIQVVLKQLLMALAADTASSQIVTLIKYYSGL